MLNKTLEDLRKEIDTLDEELLSILSKRFAVVKKVGEIKKEKNIPPLDEKRWQEVVAKITQKAEQLNISKELITKIYEEIHQEALKIEK